MSSYQKAGECSSAGAKKTKQKNSQFDEDICKPKQTGGGKDREREGCGMITGAVSEREANRDGERVNVKEEA